MRNDESNIAPMMTTIPQTLQDSKWTYDNSHLPSGPMDRKSLVSLMEINRPFQPQQGPASGRMAPVL